MYISNTNLDDKALHALYYVSLCFQKSGLYAHRATHFDATLECQYCYRKFRDKCGLNKHERTHTGKKHYQCHVCGHAFNQCTPYYQHMEKRHNLDRGSIKDIMKIVMEAKKRNGEKVDLFIVPNNIKEIMTNLKLEEELSKPKFNYIFESTQNRPEIKADIENSYSAKLDPMPEPIVPTATAETLMQHTVPENMLVQNSANTSLAITTSENGSLTLNLQTLEPMKPVPLKLYSGQSLVDMQVHPQPIQPTDNMTFTVTEQPDQSSGLMSLEPMKNLIPSGGHPKQKMKLLSHYVEYQQHHKISSPSPHDHQQQLPMTTKVDQIPISIAVPTYGQPGVTLAGTGMDQLPDAYTTSDFIERILQGH